MTNEAVVTLGGIALILALASGARANWKTDVDQPKTVKPKEGETWRLTGTTTTEISDLNVEEYRTLLSASGVADVLDVSVSADRKSFVAVLRYLRDSELALGVRRSLSPGLSITLTDAVRV